MQSIGSHEPPDDELADELALDDADELLDDDELPPDEDDDPPLLEEALDAEELDEPVVDPDEELDPVAALSPPLPPLLFSKSPSSPVAQLHKARAGTITPNSAPMTRFMLAVLRTTPGIVANSRIDVGRNDLGADIAAIEGRSHEHAARQCQP